VDNFVIVLLQIHSGIQVRQKFIIKIERDLTKLLRK